MNEMFLKGFMRKHGDTMDALAEALKIHPHTLYMKMREQGERKQQFTQSEIQVIVKRYNLTPEDVMRVFFDES